MLCIMLDVFVVELFFLVGLLKIDVEGFECVVIVGVVEFLWCDCLVLLVEIYGGVVFNLDLEWIIVDICVYGYELFVYVDDVGL